MAQSNDNVIEVNGLYKKYCRNLKRSLFYGLQDMSRDSLGMSRSKNLRPQEFWVLQDIHFNLKRGESLGLIGKNGSGKTTLLKVLSGLIKPERGTATIRGQLAPLIALGAGISPILSGRENIYINMTILGLTKTEIDRRLDAVIDFAELATAVDAPVQTYSSGMAARLGFACAVFTDPDILLVDEVLAVGDLKFRAKCYRKISELRKQGTSLILVAHAPVVILSNCTRVLYLKEGQCVFDGDPQKGTLIYEQDLFGNSLPTSENNEWIKKTDTSGPDIEIIKISYRSDENLIDTPLVTGAPSRIVFEVLARKPFAAANLRFQVRDAVGENAQLYSANSALEGKSFTLIEGLNKLSLELGECVLAPGTYTLKAFTSGADQSEIHDAVDSFSFKVHSTRAVEGLVHHPRRWLVNDQAI